SGGSAPPIPRLLDRAVARAGPATAIHRQSTAALDSETPAAEQCPASMLYPTCTRSQSQYHHPAVENCSTVCCRDGDFDRCVLQSAKCLSLCSNASLTSYAITFSSSAKNFAFAGNEMGLRYKSPCAPIEKKLPDQHQRV